LQEFHPARSRPIAEALAAAGLEHQVASAAGYGLEVFIASAHPLEGPMPLVGQQPMIGGYTEVYLTAEDCVVAGVYVPVISAVPLTEKRRFWAMLHEAADRHSNGPYAVMGDWNTGDVPLDKEDAGSPFSCTPEYRRMKNLGYEEAWRAIHGERREYTWISNRGNGFRIDHAFLSPPARQRLVDARYSHEERLAKISDHSIMIVDLAAAEDAQALTRTSGEFDG
jgi:exodeoxyribonuclease III